jgi:hypothetical protein
MKLRKSTPILVWSSVCWWAVAAISCANARGPLAPELASIVESGKLKSLRSVQEVPADVLRVCFPHQIPADPGKDWNPTDVVRDAKLPFSRVRWLAADDTHWLFSWEHGGIAYTVGFMMVTKTQGAAPVAVWDAGGADRRLLTFEEFQEYVRSNGVFSDPSPFRP